MDADGSAQGICDSECLRQLPRRLLIEDHNGRRARAIPSFNSATGLHRNLQRAEIPRIDKLQTNQEKFLHSGQAQIFAPLHTLQRQPLRDGCLLDSRHGLKPLNHGFIESGGAGRRRICRRGKIDRHRNNMVDSHPGIDLLKFRQALEQECRAADEHDGSRHFTDDNGTRTAALELDDPRAA